MALRRTPSPKGGSASVAPFRPARRSTNDPVNICRLRVPLPESAWIARFSRQFPDVKIEVLSRLDVDRGRSLTEIELHVPDAGPWADEIRALAQVSDVEELEGAPGKIHLRVVHRTSGFIPIFRELRLMRRFPFTIRAGDAFWVIVAPESKHRALFERIHAEAPSAVIESIRHSDPEGPNGPLTPRQADLLRRAMAAGYFEVPRKVTLTGLAKNLGMAASSLSEGLAIVEKKLLERWPASG